VLLLRSAAAGLLLRPRTAAARHVRGLPLLEKKFSTFLF
jgi:hypothetical protein